MLDAEKAHWSSLFGAADAFRALAPWGWMDDGQVFGVEDPESGETAWCAVLGMRGEVFALAAYRGAAGLDIYQRTLAGELGPDDNEIRFGFPCLMTSFEDRQDLEASDLSLIKAVGLSFRGRNARPLFRRYRSGFYPWRLEGSEVPLLTMELGKIFGRKVDLNTPGFLSRYYRDEVVSEAKPLYVAAQ